MGSLLSLTAACKGQQDQKDQEGQEDQEDQKDHEYKEGEKDQKYPEDQGGREDPDYMNENGLSPNEEGLSREAQKPFLYNRLLPYNSRINDEAAELFAEIRSNLARSVALHQVNPVTGCWASNLDSFLSLYGYHFSKKHHVELVEFLLELIVIKGLDLVIVGKVAHTISLLLKERDLLSRADLSIEWRPLYLLYERLLCSRERELNMLRPPPGLPAQLEQLVASCRPFFPPTSTLEMLDEWEPLLCPFDQSMQKAMNYFQLFLPTTLLPEHHDTGFRLWFPNFIGLWQNIHNTPEWEASLVRLFSRLAEDTIGYIEWDPYIPTLFTRLLRSFNLPERSSDVSENRHGSCYTNAAAVSWVAALLRAILYSSLEAPSEPNDLNATIACVAAVGRNLVRGGPSFPEGPAHVVRILTSCLREIDSDDFEKTTLTLHMVRTFVQLIPLVDCSEAVVQRTDLSGEEKEVCLTTAGFRNFVLDLIDRCFSLIEKTSASDFTPPGVDKWPTTGKTLESYLKSTLSAVFQQCSPEIFKIVACDGKVLQRYMPSLRKVLRHTLALPSVPMHQLSCNLLKNLLRACSKIFPSEYRSTSLTWDKCLDFANNLPTREWGQRAQLQQIGIRWHVPTAQELSCVQDLLQAFLRPQLRELFLWSCGEHDLSSDQVQRCLAIARACVQGAATVLPMWPEEPVDFCELQVREHTMKARGDDVGTIRMIIKVYDDLMFFWGVPADVLEATEKEVLNSRKWLGNWLCNPEEDTRALMIQRAHIQQEMREVRQSKGHFTNTHRYIMQDVFRLGVGTPMEVRMDALELLYKFLDNFPGSHNLLIDGLVELLSPLPESRGNNELSAALSIILGDKHRTLLLVRDWSFLGRLWPALVGAQHSEVPAIVQIQEDIIEVLLRHHETLQIKLEVRNKF
ncbi:proteasome activator complex subunit 4-like [Haemaphysalis longicornis]